MVGGVKMRISSPSIINSAIVDPRVIPVGGCLRVEAMMSSASLSATSRPPQALTFTARYRTYTYAMAREADQA